MLVEHRPPHWPAVLAVDASTWDRCDAETSPQRGFYYHASKHSNGQPIVAGWSYQWICQLDWAPDSWTAPIDARRIPVGSDVTDATAAQIRELVDLLDSDQDATVPLFVFDAGYDPSVLPTNWPTPVHSCWCASVTTGCSTPTPSSQHQARWAGPAATATGSSAASSTPGPPPTSTSWSMMPATAPSR